MDLPCPAVLLVVTNSSHLQLPRACCWSTAFPGRAVPGPAGASSIPLFPPSPAWSTASLGMGDGDGKARRKPEVFKPLIKDLAGQQRRVCPAVVGAVNVFWVHFITQVCFSFLQRAAREPSSLSRGKVPALPALPIAGPPLERQWSALVEMAFSGQTRTPPTAPAPVSPALGKEGRLGKLWR